jgi:hypothetical protein
MSARLPGEKPASPACERLCAQSGRRFLRALCLKPQCSLSNVGGLLGERNVKLLLAFVGVLSLLIGFEGEAQAQQLVSLKNGEQADLGAVFWIENCQSRLVKFSGIDLLNGPPGLKLSLREEAVAPSARYNCSNRVPGATVVLSANGFTSKYEGTISYRVRYDTRDGNKQSSHSAKVQVFP